MLKYRFFLLKKKWGKIINDAFTSNEVHVFSEKYIHRREQIINNSLGRKKQEKTLKQI